HKDNLYYTLYIQNNDYLLYTIPQSRLFAGLSFTNSSPIKISPDVGFSNPAIHLIVVVFPHPEGPRRAKNSPSRTSKLIFSNARYSPNFFVKFFTLIEDDLTFIKSPFF